MNDEELLNIAKFSKRLKTTSYANVV